MTLETCLKRLPTETLEKIYEAREIGYETTEKMPKQRAALVARIMRDLKNGFSHSAMLQETDARMLRLLQFAVISEKQEHVLWEDIIELAGGKKAEASLRDTFTRLEEFGLLFEEEDGSLFLQTELKRMVPVPLSERYGLEQCLLNENASRLQQLARKNGLPAEGNKEVLTGRMIAKILHQPPGQRSFETLEGEEKRVFEALIEQGGVAPITEFARRHAPTYRPQNFYSSAVRTYSGSYKSSAIEDLMDKGLVFLVSYAYSFSQQIVIPRDILRVVREEDRLNFWIGSPPSLKPLAQAVTMTQHNDSILSDCVLFMAALTRFEALQTQSGLINKVALRNIGKLYFNENDLYAGFIYSLLVTAGYIMPYGDRFRFVVTQQGMAWLAAPPPVQWLSLMSAWLQNPLWLETREDPLSTDGDFYTGRSVLDVRATLLETLPPGETEFFYDLRSLTEAMLYRIPLLMTTLGSQSELASPQRYFERVIGESLVWMGCVETAVEKPVVETQPEPEAKTPAKPATKRGQKVAAEPPPIPVGFRFTPAGTALFTQDLTTLQSLTPQEEGFYLQPNGDLIVPPYLNAAIRYRLALFADPVAKQAGAMQINRDSLRRALDEGETQKELLDFLQKHSRSGVPQPIDYLIKEIAGKHGHIRIGAAKFYLTVDDPVLLKELRARKELAAYFRNQIGETAVAIETDDAEKLMRDLRKAGYSPVRDEPVKKKRVPPKALTSQDEKSDALRALEEMLGRHGLEQLMENFESNE